MSVKLLLADESITIRKVVQIIFRNSDTKVSVVGSYEELLGRIHSEAPDVLLLSSTFPGVNLQKEFQTISGGSAFPVILMAERTDSVNQNASKKLGASGFLFKPLDNRELKKTVDDVLAKAKEPDEEQLKTPDIETPKEPVKTSAKTESGPQVQGLSFAGTPEQRAKVLMEVMESYMTENTALFTEALAKNLAPKIAPEVASKIMGSIDFSNLPFKVATIIEGVISDLVPQLAEALISRELDKIKEEAARMIADEAADAD